MIDCLVMGDSIAVGTHAFRPECAMVAKVGVTSQGWDRRFGSHDLAAGVVIISLGTNDWAKADTRATLVKIRSKIQANRVYWIEPNVASKPDAAMHVRQVASEYGDTIISTTRWQPDRIHPSWAGYRSIAESAK